MTQTALPDNFVRDLVRIEVGIRLNYSLVKDGRHPAVDYDAVWARIDALLDEYRELTKR